MRNASNGWMGLVGIVVVLCVMAWTAPVEATVVLEDDFDTYTDGDLNGQTAPNGQTWVQYTTYSNQVGAAYGHTGKGIASLNDWNDNGDDLALGTTLSPSGGYDTVVLSFDAYRPVSGAWGWAVETYQQVTLRDTASGNSIAVRWRGLYNQGSPLWDAHSIRVEGLGFTGVLDQYRAGWLNFELSVNLTTGATQLIWDNLNNSDGATYNLGNFDTGTYAFAPDEVRIYQRRVSLPSPPGLDNLKIEMIPEPGLVAGLSILGGLALLRRKRGYRG